MRYPCRLILILFLSLSIIPHTLLGHKGHPHTTRSMEFVENKNQWHQKVLFKANFNNGSIFAEKHTLTYVILNEKQLDAFRENKLNGGIPGSGLIDAASYKMKFVNANPEVRISGKDKLPYYHNYYLGNDPAKWASGVSIYNNLIYKDIYHGIDLYLLEKDGYFKYEFIVAENVSPDGIMLEYEGVNSLTLSGQDLIVTTSVGQVKELSPRAFQILENGDTLEVSCKYKIEKKRVRFILGNYRKDLKLIIDPTLIFSSFSGSRADNWGFTATYDNEGNLYGGGITFNNGYPLINAYQENFAGGRCDITISKFNATGTNLYFSTYLGGSRTEFPSSMVVNHNNELYVLGTTGSQDFPVTTGAYDTTFHGGSSVTLSNTLEFNDGADMVISKFKSDGTQLLASSYIGGTGNDGLNLSDSLIYTYGDDARGEIILDDQSNVYVASSTVSPDFPVTPGAFQPQIAGRQDVCVFKMNHNLSNLIWSSYLGGALEDAGYSLVISSDNTVYVCGGTHSSNFPVTPDAVQTATSEVSSRNRADGFITHIHEFGTRILHSTYLGTSYYDQTFCIKNDRDNYPHVVGQTKAPGYEWITNATWFYPNSGQFITKLSPRLDSIIWSTSFGTGERKPNITPTAFLVDVCNNIYVSGWGGPNYRSGTTGLPVTADAFQSTTDGADFYFLCIDGDASSLQYATFFGGTSTNSGEHVDGGTSRFDKKGRIYQAICAGCSGISNYPVTPGAWSEVNGSGNCNLGVMKMDFNLPIVVADFSMPNIICIPQTINFVNNSQELNPNTTTYLWDFGDGTTSTRKNPTHDFNIGGTYRITLVITDPGSCNYSDTLSRDILVMANARDTLPTGTICEGDAIQIGIPPHSDENISYRWLPEEGLNNSVISNPVASPNITTEYILYISDGTCSDTLSQIVQVTFIDIEGDDRITICPGDSVTITPTHGNREPNTGYFWSITPDFTQILNEDSTKIEITVAPEQSATYYLKVKMKGCELIKPFIVTISYIETVDPLPVVVCFEDTGSITVEAICHNCTHLYYTWADHPSIISDLDEAYIRILPEDNQSYYVTITNEFGCEAKDTVDVTKQKNTFPRDVEAWCGNCNIIQGDTCFLFSTTFDDGLYTYQWTPASSVVSPNASESPAVPGSTTVYEVKVTDIYGCSKSDTVLILVQNTYCGEPYIFVPNAFTPNGDHLNDILYVRGERVIKSFVFRVYNRWGEMVFESRDLNSGWDGTYKGQEAPPGVYDYYLEAVCDQEKNFVKKGNVTLIR